MPVWRPAMVLARSVTASRPRRVGFARLRTAGGDQAKPPEANALTAAAANAFCAISARPSVEEDDGVAQGD